MPTLHINANTTYQCRTHINAAHISISQAYHFIAICYQSDYSIPLLYKKSHFTQHHFHVDLCHADNTRALRPLPPILPVSSQLDLRFNSTELFKIIARAIMLPQHIAFSPKPSTIMLVVATVFSKNRCSQFIPFVLYIGILKTMDRLRSCAQPQRFFPGVVNLSIVCRNGIFKCVTHKSYPLILSSAFAW